MRSKILAAIFFIFIFVGEAFPFDSQWLENYKEQKSEYIAATAEVERYFQNGLMFTADDVRKRIANLASEDKFDRQMAEDYIDVLESGGGYVWAYDFSAISAPPKQNDKVALWNSTENKHDLPVYDEFAYELKKMRDMIAYYALVIFDENIWLKKDLAEIPKYETNRDMNDTLLKFSVSLFFSKRIVPWLDKAIEHFFEAEKALEEMKKNVSFSADLLNELTESIKAQKAGIESKVGATGQNSILKYLYQVETDYLDSRIELLKIRHEVFNGIGSEKIWERSDAVNAVLDSCVLEIERVKDLVAGLAEDEDPDLQKDTIRKFMQLTTETFPRLIFLCEQIKDDISQKTDWLVILKNLTQEAANATYSFLGTEILSGDGYRLTLRKLIFMLVFFAASVFFCKWLSRILQRILFSRLTKNESAASLIQKVIFYSLLFFSILISFNLNNIPITSFSFIGGALAIGIGLATQSTFNNVISGFILITTRPFKPGDRIVFEDTTSEVIEVSDRSTHLRSEDGIDIFVQNKMFLESTVANKTYRADSKRRLKIDVGVSYDSDWEKVENCMMGIAKGNKDILENPKPFVVINELAAGSVAMSLYCWIHPARSYDVAVAGALRFQILKEFGKNDITIPFPQLDVSLKQ